MKNFKLKLAAVLFVLGLLGVISMLTVSIDMSDLPADVVNEMPPALLKVLPLLSPLMLVIISIAIGTPLHDKVGLSVPTVSNIIRKQDWRNTFVEQLKYGAVGGLVAGVLILIVASVFTPMLPEEFLALGEKVKITPVARLLYGGIVEELMMRFGLLTLVVWLILKVTKRLTDGVYWTAIVVAASLFAVGHFPVAFSVVPEPSAGLLSYILLGNAVAGLIFGWLYWRKGLEAATLGHMFAHVVMMIGEPVLNLT